MKKSLSLILLLTTTTLAFAQGSLEFVNDTTYLIYFTTDTSHLAPADQHTVVDGFPLAGSGLYTGLAGDSNPGTIQSLAGSPTFIAGLWAGTSPSSLSLQTTSTIDNWDNEGSVVPVAVTFASLPAGVAAYFQIQVYDSRDANANASLNAGRVASN